jgi:hypothetical protein
MEYTLLRSGGEIGGRDQHAETLAPDDDAWIVFQIDARWYCVTLAALNARKPPRSTNICSVTSDELRIEAFGTSST